MIRVTTISQYGQTSSRQKFRLQQKSIVSKWKAKKAARGPNIVHERAYNLEQLAQREPGGWQARVFEDAIKRLDKEIPEIDAKIDQAMKATTLAELPSAPPGAVELVIGATVFSVVLITVCSVATIMLSGSMASISEDSDAVGRAMGNLKDPWSMKVTGVSKSDGKVTVRYRAKNSFGAYVSESQTFDR